MLGISISVQFQEGVKLTKVNQIPMSFMEYISKYFTYSTMKYHHISAAVNCFYWHCSCIYLQCICNVFAMYSKCRINLICISPYVDILAECMNVDLLSIVGLSLAIQVFLWLVLLPVSFTICLLHLLLLLHWSITIQTSPFLIKISGNKILSDLQPP